MVITVNSLCSIPVQKLKEIINQAERFHCNTVSVLSDSQLRIVGIKIASQIQKDDTVITIDSSGTEFYKRYVEPYIRTSVKSFTVDPKTEETSLRTSSTNTTGNVFIIDDVIDSGSTVRKVLSLLKKIDSNIVGKNMKICTVVTFKKDLQFDECKNCSVEYHMHNENGSYVVFPWEME